MSSGVLARSRELTPEFAEGIGVTLAIAAATTLGKLAVPVAVQQTIDSGVQAAGGPDVGRIVVLCALAALVVVITAGTAWIVNVRLFEATEAGLATLRVRAFRHVHDLAVLTQGGERRGSLVSRVTSDVDTISTFLQTGMLVLVLSAGQVLLATALMFFYSWQLALVVLGCFVPLVLARQRLQRPVTRAYRAVRVRMGDLLAALSEAVVGADVIRAHAASERSWRRIDATIEAHRRQAVKAQTATAVTFSSGVFVSGLVVALVIVVGTLLGLDGDITLGRLLAFLFLAQLWVGPVQAATEVLNELQNALAGWRRVVDLIDTPVTVPEPAQPRALPAGPVDVRVEDVAYTYPGTDKVVLAGVSLHFRPGSRTAVVGETGSGKTTLSRLVTRLVDPTSGRVLLNGVDARDLPSRELHRRVVAVPQEGFLFDATVGENVRRGKPGATDADVRGAFDDLGLSSWLDALPEGLATPVGQRGERLSAGERQLVALARAHLADPDLLVLDEATSSVDPATEVRLQRALEGVLSGRTSVAIAHRLSTAEAADTVVVVDSGRVVEVGPAAELAHAGGPYSRLHAAWTAQHA
ncbi:ABC-type multidrug transport system fused ATPase/permease subunit [Kineococcus radiotolerans]|uniref:ABC transporter related n=2 Tax=Kineococcus radiotolerans TaxID=131568 RepID=A6WG85_KINRD|nr:ABC transporter ATP-binding protein [Kineococcus radiotolerans]ABS05824.1 ABC transporter related [Kineococcus radiotolerans SRS30216 = ATCC BAA-149]MBB2902708.1 ABC-type multidrug transport system fused ATPase/permease subunit [Kineococcus radiotolerans]